jgi:hypothetical protein
VSGVGYWAARARLEIVAELAADPPEGSGDLHLRCPDPSGDLGLREALVETEMHDAPVVAGKIPESEAYGESVRVESAVLHTGPTTTLTPSERRAIPRGQGEVRPGNVRVGLVQAAHGAVLETLAARRKNDDNRS